MGSLVACGESNSNSPGGAAGSAGSAGSAHAGAGQSGGSPATGGVAMSGGTAGSTSGGAPADPGAHCVTPAPAPQHADCGLDGFDQGLPNPVDLFVDSLGLEVPMTAGEPYALSITTTKQGVDANVELWGADEECGTARELLWYGAAANSILCAEFRPSRAFSHVIVAVRPLRDASNYSFSTTNFTVCPAGSCPAGAVGTGREAAPLQAPVGAYDFSNASYYFGISGPIGATGYLLAVRDGAPGPTTNYAQGIFRMPPNDPFGDAWYCFGPGTTQTKLNEDESQMSLKGVTRLGSCADQTGTGTASVISSEGGVRSVITTNVPELAFGPQVSSSGGCQGNLSCSSSINDPPKFTWLRASLDADVGTFTQPAATPANVTMTEWVMYNNVDGQPLGVVCGKGGTATPSQDMLDLELQGLTFLKCPGTAAASDSLDFIMF